MSNGYTSWEELGRAFDRFYHEEYVDWHDDVREELKFLRRLLFATLGTALLAGLLTSALTAIRGA